MVPFVRSLACALTLTVAAVAQNSWSCPDNGSTTIATNSGSGNSTFVMKKSTQTSADQTLEIVIYVAASGNQPEQVIETITWNTNTDVTVILGSGKSLRVQDPADDDTLGSNGSYSVS